MKFNFLRGCLFLTVLILFSGCATQQPGYNEGSSKIGYLNKVVPSTAGIFIQPEKLKDGEVIKPKDAFSIKLLSAYICDFRESESWRDFITKSNKDVIPCNGGDGSQRAQTRGEIAIVANVGERRDNIGLSFDPNDTRKSGRIIYYNEDVRETGQLINALNIPVYGPKTYNGDSFYMDWSVLELDTQESNAARGTIKRLAELGGVAYPPGAPVLNLLNNIGSAMLASNGDDVEMRYQMEFDAYMNCTDANCESTPQVYRAPLRQGYYALLRSERRDLAPPLKQLKVCEEDGLLCDRQGEPYRQASWLLLRVSREDTDRATKQDDTAKLATLLDSLNKTEELKLDEIIKAITEAKKQKEN